MLALKPSPNHMAEVVPYHEVYLDDALHLIARSDSTDRSRISWNGCNMTAMLARRDHGFVGIIPLEKRSLRIASSRVLNALWVSGAHVAASCRSQGIGTAMDEQLRDAFSPAWDGVFAFRGDENSRAYRWYKRRGYADLLSILSFKKAVDTKGETIRAELWDDAGAIVSGEKKLLACFNQTQFAYSGYPQRYDTFWSDKVKFHYYRDAYRYSVLALGSSTSVAAYALLGQTSMRDGIFRFDILEFVCPNDTQMRKELMASISALASQKGCVEIRIQLSAYDDQLSFIQRAGFTSRWRTNMIGRLLDPMDFFRRTLTQHSEVEETYRFVIETPSLGKYGWGTGQTSISIFLHDDLFQQLLLNRCHVSQAVEEQRLVVMDGRDHAIAVLKQLFPFRPWRYFHIDYA